MSRKCLKHVDNFIFVLVEVLKSCSINYTSVRYPVNEYTMSLSHRLFTESDFLDHEKVSLSFSLVLTGCSGSHFRFRKHYNSSGDASQLWTPLLFLKKTFFASKNKRKTSRREAYRIWESRAQMKSITWNRTKGINTRPPDRTV